MRIPSFKTTLLTTLLSISSVACENADEIARKAESDTAREIAKLRLKKELPVYEQKQTQLEAQRKLEDEAKIEAAIQKTYAFCRIGRNIKESKGIDSFTGCVWDNRGLQYPNLKFISSEYSNRWLGERKTQGQKHYDNLVTSGITDYVIDATRKK